MREVHDRKFIRQAAFDNFTIMYSKKVCLFLALSLLCLNTFAQNDSLTTKEIDPSKPTNLYTQINAVGEYSHSSFQKLSGVRFNIQYAIDPDNLILAEIPVLSNSNSNTMGLADMRIRYFRAIKRNISPRFIAIAPFADISLPTGSYAKGLGSSQWSIGFGLVGGYIVSSKFAVFPGVGFVHLTKPSTNLISESAKYSSTGVSLQLNGSLSFSKSTFLFINPSPVFLNTNGKWKGIWSGELNLNKIITPNKFKANIGFAPNFTYETYIYRAGATLYF